MCDECGFVVLENDVKFVCYVVIWVRCGGVWLVVVVGEKVGIVVGGGGGFVVEMFDLFEDLKVILLFI